MLCQKTPKPTKKHTPKLCLNHPKERTTPTRSNPCITGVMLSGFFSAHWLHYWTLAFPFPSQAQVKYHFFSPFFRPNVSSHEVHKILSFGTLASSFPSQNRFEHLKMLIFFWTWTSPFFWKNAQVKSRTFFSILASPFSPICVEHMKIYFFLNLTLLFLSEKRSAEIKALLFFLKFQPPLFCQIKRFLQAKYLKFFLLEPEPFLFLPPCPFFLDKARLFYSFFKRWHGKKGASQILKKNFQATDLHLDFSRILEPTLGNLPKSGSSALNT